MKAFSYLRWIRRTTWLCLLLLGLSGAAQVLHHHSLDLVRGDAAEKTRCTICVAGQTPQQASLAVNVLPVEAREYRLREQSLGHIGQVSSDANRTRPPPSL
ncbi:MAG TPA: hypothetical protein VMZ25_01370 [Terriglobales bacterium]|nr:hypothetical protein [Terriglobales bacterium]